MKRSARVLLAVPFLGAFLPFIGSPATPARVETVAVRADGPAELDPVVTEIESERAVAAAETAVIVERLDAERREAERVAAERRAAEEAAATRAAARPQYVAPAPVVYASDAGANRALGERLAAEVGWTGSEWACLDELWGAHESGWRTEAHNPSGAHGIPQALPGSKMGPGWESDPEVQIRWGLGYIAARYGTPCAADANFHRVGSY